MRKVIIAGNWKMNKTVAEARQFVQNLKNESTDIENVEAVICAPYTQLAVLKEELKNTNIKLAAQNCYYEQEGAFTGEISAKMLTELVEYVVLGHSERREIFNETDEMINQKVIAVLSENLKPILCVGESLSERENGTTDNVVANQLNKNLKDVSAEKVEKVVIAYEPIWAIGTGKTATAEQAQETIANIRKEITKMYNEETANKVVIQYGGSVKPENVKEILSKNDIDGALVGGASLEVADYVGLIKGASNEF